MKISNAIKGLLACAVMAVLVTSCTSTGREASGENGTTGSQTQEEYTVEITQMKFTPAELTVHSGDKVTFMNHDLVTHDITEDPGKSWSSSPLPADESWSMTVTQSSNYYCTLHPTMKGKIIVQ